MDTIHRLDRNLMNGGASFWLNAQAHVQTILKKKEWTAREDEVHIRHFVNEMLGDQYPFIGKTPGSARGECFDGRYEDRDQANTMTLSV